MSSPTSDRQALREHWRERLKDAKIRLDFVRNFTNEVQRDWAIGLIPEVQEPFVIAQVLRAERHALSEYRRILREYSDLALHGMVPAQSANCKPKSMPKPSPNRKALEELWRNRVNDAKAHLDSVRNHLRQVVHDPTIDGSDGDWAYREAIRAENSALKEYARVMRTYRDLTVNGVIPAESE